MGPVSRYDVPGYREVGGEDVSDLPGQLREQQDRVAVRLAEVDRVLAVMSGKGGVGKSLVAAALAAALAESGREVGLLDADLDGPTGARMLGAGREPLEVAGDGVRPAGTDAGVRLVSTALLLEEDAPLEWEGPRDESWVWRSAQERGMLREFLSDVAWGALDVLVVDLPPGPARFEQLAGLVPGLEGTLAVTLPSGASGSAVRRSLRRAGDVGVDVAGVVENMAGYACPGCDQPRPLFPGEAGADLARDFGAPLLGRVPFDPAAAEAADAGRVDRLLEATAAGRELRRVAGRIAEGGAG